MIGFGAIGIFITPKLIPSSGEKSIVKETEKISNITMYELDNWRRMVFESNGVIRYAKSKDGITWTIIDV